MLPIPSSSPLRPLFCICTGTLAVFVALDDAMAAAIPGDVLPPRYMTMTYLYSRGVDIAAVMMSEASDYSLMCFLWEARSYGATPATRVTGLERFHSRLNGLNPEV